MDGMTISPTTQPDSFNLQLFVDEFIAVFNILINLLLGTYSSASSIKIQTSY